MKVNWAEQLVVGETYWVKTIYLGPTDYKGILRTEHCFGIGLDESDAIYFEDDELSDNVMVIP